MGIDTRKECNVMGEILLSHYIFMQKAQLNNQQLTTIAKPTSPQTSTPKNSKKDMEIEFVVVLDLCLISFDQYSVDKRK